MKALKIFSVALFVLSGFCANAQRGQLKLNIQYSYAKPTGSFRDNVISEASSRGVTGDILYGISNKLSFGLGLGYQDFYQKYPRSLYETNHNETTSAVLSNSVQVVPVLAKAELHPFGGSKFPVQPYVSVGAGFGIANFTQYLGEFGGNDNSAGFMVQGGAGLAIPVNKNGSAGLKFGANYNRISYNRNGFDDFNNISYQAGLFFPIQ